MSEFSIFPETQTITLKEGNTTQTIHYAKIDEKYKGFRVMDAGVWLGMALGIIKTGSVQIKGKDTEVRVWSSEYEKLGSFIRVVKKVASDSINTNRADLSTTPNNTAKNLTQAGKDGTIGNTLEGNSTDNEDQDSSSVVSGPKLKDTEELEVVTTDQTVASDSINTNRADLSTTPNNTAKNLTQAGEDGTIGNTLEGNSTDNEDQNSSSVVSGPELKDTEELEVVDKDPVSMTGKAEQTVAARGEENLNVTEELEVVTTDQTVASDSINTNSTNTVENSIQGREDGTIQMQIDGNNQAVNLNDLDASKNNDEIVNIDIASANPNSDEKLVNSQQSTNIDGKGEGTQLKIENNGHVDMFNNVKSFPKSIESGVFVQAGSISILNGVSIGDEPVRDEPAAKKKRPFIGYVNEEENGDRVVRGGIGPGLIFEVRSILTIKECKVDYFELLAPDESQENSEGKIIQSKKNSEGRPIIEVKIDKSSLNQLSRISCQVKKLYSSTELKEYHGVWKDMVDAKSEEVEKPVLILTIINNEGKSLKKFEVLENATIEFEKKKIDIIIRKRREMQ